jgi:transcriptional regulator with XRE-family HTH domain
VSFNVRLHGIESPFRLLVSIVVVMASIPKVSIRQIKAACALLDWSQERLAEAAGVSIPTIKRLEASDGELGGRSDTAAKIQSALTRAGVEFISENDGEEGVRRRKPKR